MPTLIARCFADAFPTTSSGFTRLIDRLERDGVVERRASATDGRGTVVALTADGTDREMAELRRIMTKRATGIQATTTETHGVGCK